MPVPQFLLDLLQLLLNLAVPAAFCTLAAAGVNLRHEGGTNFHVNGRVGKWVLWTVIFLTLPQLLSWIAAQGITVPSGSGSVGTPWLASMQNVLTNFVNQVVVAKFVPIVAGYFVLKATLDGAAGETPLASISRSTVFDVFVRNRTASSRLELRWAVCHHGHACFAMELHRRTDHAGSSRASVRWRCDQLRAAQTMDAPCPCRDLLLLCERTAHPFSGPWRPRSQR